MIFGLEKWNRELFVVEVRGTGKLVPSDIPDDLRADMSVDATVVVSRIENTHFVDRPENASPNYEASLFVMSEDEQSLRRLSILYGGASVSKIEILSGLSFEQKVVLSDTSAWDQENELRIN